jgi:formiminotetrahydrofolate cyclodeaminase
VGDLIEQTLGEFLESVGEETPAPGGGTSSAITVALAAALVEMAARIGEDPDDADESNGPAGRAAELRADALRLAEQELTSYGPVLKAETPADRTTALDGASEPPAQIAETAASVAELGVRVAESASPAVRGDALTGVIIAEAAAAAAARLVETNISSGPVFDRARAAAERASKARESGTVS